MILIKNTSNQVIYTKLYNPANGVPFTGATPSNIVAYITKDNGSEATAANQTIEVGHGIYKLILTQAETNCNTAFVNFVYVPGTYQFTTVDIQTTEANPSVNVVQNNDKTGYFLDNVQTFNTSGSVGSVADAASINSLIRNSTYDGVTQEKLFEMILAFISGKVIVTTINPNTRLISYKKRDGTTERFSVTVSTADGSRASVGTITP